MNGDADGADVAGVLRSPDAARVPTGLLVAASAVAVAAGSFEGSFLAPANDGDDVCAMSEIVAGAVAVAAAVRYDLLLLQLLLLLTLHSALGSASGGLMRLKGWQC